VEDLKWRLVLAFLAAAGLSLGWLAWLAMDRLMFARAEHPQ
jgi:hypothetical protein